MWEEPNDIEFIRNYLMEVIEKSSTLGAIEDLHAVRLLFEIQQPNEEIAKLRAELAATNEIVQLLSATTDALHKRIEVVEGG